MKSGYTKVAGALFILLLFSLAGSSAQKQAAGTDADTSGVKLVVSGYDDAFNQHDARAIGALFSEEGDFTNMRGASKHGRKDIEQNYGTLFAGVLKSAHRTDTVKNIRFLAPDMVEMDANWEMSGTKAADGSDVPLRKGYLDWIIAKVSGQWQIVVFHESEFPK